MQRKGKQSSYLAGHVACDKLKNLISLKDGTNQHIWDSRTKPSEHASMHIKEGYSRIPDLSLSKYRVYATC